MNLANKSEKFNIFSWFCFPLFVIDKWLLFYEDIAHELAEVDIFAIVVFVLKLSGVTGKFGTWDFFRTWRRFAIIGDSLSTHDARSLRFPFKAFTNDLMLLSKLSKESVWIMYCVQRIPYFTPSKISVVISFQARGPDWWCLLLSSASKFWSNLSFDLKSQV